MAKNAMSFDDEREVIGHYKTKKITDEDALYYENKQLMKSLSGIIGGFLFIVILLSVLLIPFTIMAPIVGIITIPVLILAFITLFYLKKKHKSKVLLIRSATEKYCAELGYKNI